MPSGKGTYGTKKGRPPKKKMPSHVGLAAKLKARKKKIEAATKKK